MSDKPWVEIADSLDVLGFYGSEGIELRPAGSGYKGKCPFHGDDIPSMSVSQRGQFNCKACGEKGSVFDFYAKRHQTDFKDSMRAVARFSGVTNADLDRPARKADVVKPFESNNIDVWSAALWKNEEVLAYLRNRGLNDESIRSFRLGWTGDRVSIPIWNAEKRIVNAKLYKVGGDSSNKMLWAERGTPSPLFIHETTDIAILMLEGEWDAILARQYGFNANTGTAGANTWKVEWSDEIRGRVVYILYDRDKPGREGALKAAASLHKVGCEVYIAAWPDGPDDGFDCTDWFARESHTPEELRALLDSAVPFVPAEKTETNGHAAVTITAIRTLEPLPLKILALVEREEVDWLWHPYIPKGKLSLMVGNPGVGKSFLTSALAGAVTQGWTLPGATEPLAVAPVILLAAEDGPADTIRPRMEDMGVTDMTQIFVLPPEEDFNLMRDMERLAKEIVDRKPALVVIDPLTSYLGGKTDMNKDNEVRAALGPLVQVAAAQGTAIIGVMHLTKGARDVLLHKVLGSVGFTGLARSVLAVAPHPERPEHRIVAALKANLAKEGQPRGFTITDGKFVWLTEIVDIDLDTLFAPKVSVGGDPKPDSQMGQAIQFIRDQLASGDPVPSAQLMQQGKKEGFSERTMKRAKTTIIGIRSLRLNDVWFWSMPPTKPGQTTFSVIDGENPDDQPPNTWSDT